MSVFGAALKMLRHLDKPDVERQMQSKSEAVGLGSCAQNATHRTNILATPTSPDRGRAGTCVYEHVGLIVATLTRRDPKQSK